VLWSGIPTSKSSMPAKAPGAFSSTILIGSGQLVLANGHVSAFKRVGITAWDLSLARIFPIVRHLFLGLLYHQERSIRRKVIIALQLPVRRPLKPRMRTPRILQSATRLMIQERVLVVSRAQILETSRAVGIGQCLRWSHGELLGNHPILGQLSEAWSPEALL
jgi:hypothetical protein